jgi:hypothetical protein
MIAIRKRIDADPSFAAFAAKEMGLNAPLLGFAEKYDATPSARLRPANGKVVLGNEKTGMVEVTKTDFDWFLAAAVKVRLI